MGTITRSYAANAYVGTPNQSIGGTIPVGNQIKSVTWSSGSTVNIAYKIKRALTKKTDVYFTITRYNTTNSKYETLARALIASHASGTAAGNKTASLNLSTATWTIVDDSVSVGQMPTAATAITVTGDGTILTIDYQNSKYTAASTLTVTYGLPTHTLTTTVSPASSGSVTAGGTIEENATKQLTATASTGYTFSSWSKTAGTLSSTTANPTTFTMGTSDATVTANFAINTYTLTTAVSPASSGTVTAGGSLTYNSKKQLTATAASGYTFSSWSKTAGTLSSTTANPTTFTIGAGNATVTANFTANTYALTVSKGTGIASVSGGGNVAYKAGKAISATMSTGYEFKTWSSNNGGTFANAASASTTFTMPVGATTVTATGQGIAYTLTVAKGTGISSVSGGGSKRYTSTNAISATASTGYSFKNWTSNNGGTFANANNASTNFTMPNGAVTVTANGQINTYTLTTAVSPTGGGTVTAGGSLTYNSKKQLTATASSGYTFSSWAATAGTLSSTTANPTTFTIGAGNATVTANFTVNTYTLTVNKGTGIATATGGGSVAYKGTKAISATMSTGYEFKNWTSNNGGTFANANAASTTFTMPVGNTTVTANGQGIAYTLTVAKGTGVSAVTGGGSKRYTTTNAITATMSTGYSFVNWTSNNGGTFANANSASTSFTMPNGNVTVTANGKINSYTLTTAVSPASSGTVTAGGSMNYNTAKQLTATAASGYTFSSWSKTAGTLSSTTANPTTFTMGTAAATVTANFTANTYALTVAKGTGIASVSGAGNVAYKATKAISATMSTGYEFKNWTSNNGGTFANANAASTSFTMPVGATTVTANGQGIAYTLTVAKGTGVSAVTGGGSVRYTNKQAITATMSTGYTFVNWTSNNGGTFASATSASTSFTMPNGNVTVTANGQINTYTLTTAVSPSGSGTVTAGGSITYNSKKQLTATAASGYTFSSWSKTAGTLSSTTTNPTTFTMGTANATVTANFTANTYTLTVNKGTGVASVSGGGSVAYKVTKAISATMTDGYEFVNWTSNNGGTFASATSASTSFTMPVGNTTITANGQGKAYTLTVAKGTGVSSVTGGGSKRYTSTNAITATMSTGYSFVNWTSNNGGTFANANSASTSFTMPNGNVTVTANGKINSYNLTVSKGTGIASVTGSGTFNYDSVNNITAAASTGYTFSGWTSNNGGTFGNASAASTTFKMPAGAVTVTANATINTYTLTVAKGTGGKSVTGGGSVEYNSSNAISATADTGYSFKNWTSNNGGTFASSTSANTTFTMPAGNTTVTANFNHDSYTLSSAVSPSGGGTVTLGATSGYYNSQIDITATPATGYAFSSWSTTNGTIANTSAASTKITMTTANATVTATFVKIDYTVSKVSNPSAGGSVTLSKSVANYGDEVTVSATANTGYSFSSWSSSPTVTISSGKFTMPASNVTITANFNHDSYTLSSAVSPSGGGSVTLGATSGYYNDSINITATPATGYQFTGWTTTGGAIGSASSASTTITMPAADTTVTANFSKINYTITTTCDPANTGTVTASPSVAQMGDTVVLSQIPERGYEFVDYTTSPAVTITNNEFVMPASNVTITGNYIVSNKIYVKVNGEWVETVEAYKKQNGVWVLQDDLTTVFDPNTNYVKGN